MVSKAARGARAVPAVRAARKARPLPVVPTSRPTVHKARAGKVAMGAPVDLVEIADT